MEALQRLDVWKRSCRLAADLYRLLGACRDRCYKEPVTRAALSIPSNIAEGYERGSPKAIVQFLRIAKGSCGELWTQLLMGRSAGLIDGDGIKQLEKEAQELSRMLHGLIAHYLSQQDTQ